MVRSKAGGFARHDPQTRDSAAGSAHTLQRWSGSWGKLPRHGGHILPSLAAPHSRQCFLKKNRVIFNLLFKNVEFKVDNIVGIHEDSTDFREAIDMTTKPIVAQMDQPISASSTR